MTDSKDKNIMPSDVAQSLNQALRERKAVSIDHPDLSAASIAETLLKNSLLDGPALLLSPHAEQGMSHEAVGRSVPYRQKSQEAQDASEKNHKHSSSVLNFDNDQLIDAITEHRQDIIQNDNASIIQGDDPDNLFSLNSTTTPPAPPSIREELNARLDRLHDNHDRSPSQEGLADQGAKFLIFRFNSQFFIIRIGESGTVSVEPIAPEVAKDLLGTRAADILTGGTGNDTLTGGFGSDTLNGGAGNDILYADGQAFSNSTVSGMTLWLDASDVNANNTTVADGTNIATWFDKSGGTADVVMAQSIWSWN